jgi:glucosamine--fructose-6-phosphate aminotransferase (isomerizing)
MCGIFGYVGQRGDAASIVLRGLKELEYRGYDSWGIAVAHEGGAALERHVGKIGEAITRLPPSPIGLGHTRWATHGGVTESNCHPHVDCQERESRGAYDLVGESRAATRRDPRVSTRLRRVANQRPR